MFLVAVVGLYFSLLRLISPAASDFNMPITSLPSQASPTLPAARNPLSETENQASAGASGIDTIDLTRPTASRPQNENEPRRTSQGTKRKSTSNEDENNVHLSQIDVSGMPLTDNADQIRRKIHRLIENGGMKVGEFCKAIGVSNNAYNRFVQQHGPSKGLQSDVYMGAAEYFARRQVAGIKLPTANSKRAKTDSSGQAGSSKSNAAAAGKKDDAAAAAADWRQIELDGEAYDDVPV